MNKWTKETCICIYIYKLNQGTYADGLISLPAWYPATRTFPHGQPIPYGWLRCWMVQRRSCRGAVMVVAVLFTTESWLKEFRQHHLGCLQIHVKNRIKFYSQLRVLALNSASQLVMRPRLSMLLNGCHPRAPQRSSCRGRPWCHRLLSG